MSLFTLQQGHRYEATITLGIFERWIGNDALQAKLQAPGAFQDVIVTGDGGLRFIKGTWSGPDEQVKVDPHLSSISEISISSIKDVSP